MFLENKKKSKKSIYTKWGIYGYGLLFFLFLGSLSFSNVLAQNNKEAQDLSQEIQGLGIIPLIQQEPVQQEPTPQEININKTNQENSTFDSIFDFFKKIKNTDSIETTNTNNKEKTHTKTGKNQNKTKTGEYIITGENNISGNIITGENNTGGNIITGGNNNISIEENIQYNEKSFDYDVFLSDILAKYYGSYNYEEHLNPKLCHYTTGDIITIKPGKNNLPEYLSGGTIYKLRDGDYISDYMIKINNNCTMIIGSKESRLLTKNTEGATIKVISGQNNIFENLILEGEENGSKKPHIANNYGIYLNSSKNIINNITSFDQARFAIYMNSFENHIINSLFLKEPIILDTGDILLDTGDILLDTGNILLDTGDILLDNGDTLLDTGDNIKKLFLEKIIQDKYKQTKIADKINKKMQFSATNNPALIDTNKPIQEIESDLTWNLFTKEKGKFKGKSSLNLERSKGKIPIDIILESLDSKHKVHLKKDSILKKKNGNVYTGIFIIPEETTEVGYSSGSELSGSKLRSAETIKIGSFEEGIYITDNSGEKQEAIIEMNISGYKSGDNVEIFSSEDGDNWETLGYYEVQEKNGETFILIPTTHFSYITAGTYYGNYFKGSISIEESFNSRDFIADCHYQINGGSRYIAMWSPGGLPGSAICATTYNTTSNFNIRFRATVEGGLIEEPRSFLNPDMLLVAGITYLYGTTDTYYYDATAPSGGSFTINNGATYTKSTAVTLNITCPTDAGVGGVKMMFSHNGSVRTTPENCVSTKSYNLLAGEGSQTVYMKFLDALGNTTTNRTDSIIVDTVAPTSAPICTNNARFISSISVACLFGIGSDIIRYTTNGSTPTTSSPIWIDKSFTTTTTLKAISCDLANNCLTDPITTKLYTKDTSPPSGGSFSINDGASYTKSTSVTLDIFCPLDNWTPVQVAYGKSSSPTNRTTCTSSIAYTLSTTNGTQTAYVRFRDGGGNTSSDITDTIILDTVSPTYIGYSNLSGYVYNNGSDYWFTPGSELWVDISHADTRRTETQYFGFNKDGCSPNSCGGAPNEIKSYIYSTFTDRMYNDSYINIYSAACVDGDGNCTTDTDVTRRWKSSINTSIPDYNYRLHTFLYDAAKNGVGYTNLGIRIKIDGTIPTTTINSPAASSVQAENFNVSISDTDVRSGIGTCKYRILDNGTQSLGWTNRTCNSSISINIGSYCTTQGTNKCTIESYSIDNVGLLSTIQSRSFSIDTTAPTITISNPNTNPATSKTITASTNEGTLTMTAGSTSTTCDASRSFVAYASTTFSSEADNGKYVCYRAIDSVGNISYKLSNAIAGIDRTAPTTTNNANSTRRSSDFSVTLTPNETSTTKYCIGTSSCSPTIVGTTANVTCSAGTTCASQYVRYYSTDTAGNTESVKTSSQIRIDKQAPSFTFANASGPECVNGSLVITSASDGGVGLHSTPYSFNGSTWNTTTSTTITAQQPGTQNRTAYVRDALGNSTSKAATYTFTNVAPTANNFVGHSSVGNTPRTVNWKTLSSATEGSCGNSSISFNTVITQGTKGSCSVVGDNITYTPNTSQAGSDSCIIQLKDNENSTVNITVSWEGIDTTAPTAAPTCTSSQYFSSSVDIVCTVGAGGTVVRYTTNGVDPSPSDPLWLNQPFSSTTTLKAISCDALNNCNLTAVTTKIYTLDNLAPTSSISDTNSNRRNTNINFTLNSSDAGVGGITSYYKSLAGDVTCTAGGFTTYSTSVAVNGTAGQAIQRTICYYSTDSLLNIETIKKQLYKIDMSDPTISAPAIYGGTTYGNYFKGTISLRSSISDIGAGILASSCMRSINAGAWTNVGMTQDASYCMYNTYNPASSFNVKFLVKDQATNTGISLQSNFTYDNTAPTISTPTIYAGTTYNNTYYKGTISIQSTATDAGSNIDTNTCEYSLNNGSSRTSATYAGGYCQISNISPATNIQILIRAKDNLGTTETSSAKTYTYDATAPITTDNASSTRTNSDQTITLSPTDAGAGVANTYYCITNSGGTCTPNIAGTSILVTGANNEITNKQIRYYSTDNLNTDETIKTSAIINIDKQGPTIELLSPENNAGFNDGSSVQLQWSGSDNGGGISGYIYNILSGGSSIISGFTTNTAIIVSGLDIGIYEWSITAIDIIDNQTVSPERSFEIKQLNYVIIPDSEINADFITAFTEVGYIDSGDILIGSKDINLETSTNGKVCPGKSIGFISTGTLYSNNIEIELPTCFYVKKSNGNPYTGIIKIPEFINNIAPDNLLLNKSTITVGTGTESIFFKNESNNDINAIIRVPTPEKELGESVKIFYSEDGQVRNYLTSTIITSYNNQPYAIFENNHFTYFTVGAIQRNTDNYLNEEFWSNNPTDDQILKALYGIGSGSAYTQNWVNYNDNCTGNTVVYTGILPSEFSANTVYVLESGNYNITGPINVRNCAAIISSGTATMVSQAELSYLQFNGTKYAIIDNISKNGNNFYNSRGIWSVAAHSNTINNFKAYNNDNGIMLINGSHDNTVNNSYIYNNDNGLQIHDSSNNTVNNTKTYNNVGYGVGITRYSSNSSYNTINNIQSFNNGQGIYLYTNYVYQNTISNSSFYNNSNGINFTSSPQNNNLVNIELYNNYNDPIAGSSTTNKYYGFLNIYGYTGTINDLYITQGTEGSVLDWTTGSIYTGNITIQNKITNPVNNSGIYLLDRSNINKQRVISWTGSVPPITYSYGSEIIKQKQPMKYSGSSIIYYGISGSDRDTSKFIGANKEPSNGSLAINEVSPTTEENITVTFTATNNMNWYLFGDITTNLNGIILANQSITTGAILSGDSGYKNVFIQLQTGDTELTHYVDTIQYEADSIAPTVSTGYISVGTTGINGSDLYYKGTISIKSDISDNIAINSGTCEYSLTGGRYAASGTNTYCEVTNITPNQDINIQFRVQDMVGNIGTGPLQNYLYDNTPPTGGDFLINNGDEYTSGTNLNLNITCATDTGINGTQIAYGTGVDPDNWTTCTTPVNVTVDSTNETKIVYIRFKDSFDNITSNIVQSIILDTTNPIIGFTGSTPTDNTITSDVSFTGEVEITEENIGSFTRNRNETEYILGSNILNLFYTSPNNNDIISTIIDQNNRMSLNITGLVLGMNFDNNLFLGDTGSTVGDFSIYNNDGIVHGATWNSGKFGGSYQFDGIDDYIGIVNNSGLSFGTNDLSISFWFLVNNKSDQTLIFGSSDSYYIQILSETLRAYFDYSNTNTRLQTSEYETGKWNHTTIVYDRDNKMSLFVNGDLKGETDISGYENNNITNSNILLGGRGYRYLSGSIDEIRIYNKALSTGEILQLYNSNLSKTDTNKRQFTSLQTGLTEGFYTYLSTVTDNVGNTASTETRTITIDQTGPEVIFTGSTPADNSTISGNHFSGFAEITETNLSSFTRNRDGTNYPIYDSGLVLMMNFDNIAALGETTGGIIKDLSIYGNDGTGYNNPSWTSNGKFGGAYEFNGTTQYISTQTKILGSSATFIAWGKTNNISTGMLWNHPVDISVTYFDLLFSYNTIYLNRGNGYTNPFNSGGINVSQPTTGERHNYATIIDYTENKAFLYIDGKYVGEAMYRNPTSTNTGRIFSIAGANSYRWSGYIDDFYIYNRALSSGEILQLYKSNLSKYDTDKRQFTTEQSCLIDRTYNYSITTTDNLNNETTTGRSLTIQLPNPTVGTPTYGLNLPEITNGLEDQTIEQSFTGEDNNFWVYDTKGYTGWYTTIQLSGGLLNPDGTHEIAQENIQFKADPTITTIEGQISTAVALATGMDEYKTMTGIYNYIIKNYTPECSSCIIGKYGNTPSLKVTIPAFQKADTYNGTIIFTLYN